MKDPSTYQTHVSANQDGRDLALRATVTAYDENGWEIGTKTVRRHVTGLDMADLDAQLLYHLSELLKMVAEEQQRRPLHDVPDTPLF